MNIPYCFALTIASQEALVRGYTVILKVRHIMAVGSGSCQTIWWDQHAKFCIYTSVILNEINNK